MLDRDADAARHALGEVAAGVLHLGRVPARPAGHGEHR
jgi:hypothetical protein